MSPGRPAFLRQMLAFVLEGRRAWLVPLFIVLFLVIAIAGVVGLAPFALFLYPL
jgi:hypothetical protein